MKNGTINRKKEHLKIAQNHSVHFEEITSGFEHYHFVHNALPEMNIEDIDFHTTFLGYDLKLPLIICSMSGGEQEGEMLNRDLAIAANKSGIALALGSIRPALENRDALGSFLVARENAPDIPIIANIGATQLVKDFKTKDLLKLLKEIQVDAISIHLNPLQEALQPEGEPHFKGVSRAIEILRETLPYPVIVKEVGFGLSFDVIKRLQKMGIQWIDIAGAGGTSWSRIEHMRTDDNVHRRIASQFFEWGIPTVDAILHAVRVKQMHIIASGGIDDGLKFAKAIALGADLAGAATLFLRARNSDGVEGITNLIKVFSETLRISMFCCGCRNLEEFRGNQSIISSRQK